MSEDKKDTKEIVGAKEEKDFGTIDFLACLAGLFSSREPKTQEPT